MEEDAKKIQEIVEKKQDVTFAELEQSVNASFNLIFLAIDAKAKQVAYSK